MHLRSHDLADSRIGEPIGPHAVPSSSPSVQPTADKASPKTYTDLDSGETVASTAALTNSTFVTTDTQHSATPTSRTITTPPDQHSTPATSNPMTANNTVQTAPSVINDIHLQARNAPTFSGRREGGSSDHTYIPGAFAPRDQFVRLAFPQATSTEHKLRWTAAVHRELNLDRSQRLIRVASIRSPFVYVARSLSQEIQRMLDGDFASVQLQRMDVPVRQPRLPEYLVTKFPKELDISVAYELEGVATARRVHHYLTGDPLNRIYITWNKTHPPPATFSFPGTEAFSPPPKIDPANPRQVQCYKCWQYGHIAKHCSSPQTCAWCSENHWSRECPHQKEAVDADNAAQPPANDDSDPNIITEPTPPKMLLHPKFKCPRCHTPGVPIWHTGCPAKPAAPALTTTRHPTQPQLLTAATTGPDSHPHFPPLPQRGPSTVAPATQPPGVSSVSFTTRLTGLEHAVSELQRSVQELVAALPNIIRNTVHGTIVSPQQQQPTTVGHQDMVFVGHQDTASPEPTAAPQTTCVDQVITANEHSKPVNHSAAEEQSPTSHGGQAGPPAQQLTAVTHTVTRPSSQEQGDIFLQLCNNINYIKQCSAAGQIPPNVCQHMANFNQQLVQLLQVCFNNNGNNYG